MNTVYLVKVDPAENNNKFYRMIDKGSGTFTVEYGRIGNDNFATFDYSMSEWDKKYNEKLRKGYTDQSQLYAVPAPLSQESTKKLAISNSQIASLVEQLMAYAKRSIRDNYTIDSRIVTESMIKTAQDIIFDLHATSDIANFNRSLVTLFTVIPRKMSNVADNIAHDPHGLDRILRREQDLLDVMRGQVAVQEIQGDNIDTQDNQSILEALGLEIENTNDSDRISILKNAGELSGKVYNSWRVKNKKTQENYRKFVKEAEVNKELELWHGSRNENWWGIVNEGLLLRPNSAITGKMFGYGIYFAPSSKKSYGYTSCQGSYWARGNSPTGYMGIFNVAYGKPLDVYSHSNGLSSMTYESLKKQNPNAHCVHAHAGNMLYNDEIIVYNESQTTIKYLVEFR